MTLERWFVRELKLLDPDLFVSFHPRLKRWQIRQWVLSHTRRGVADYHEWRSRSALIRTVCYRDDEFYDIGFHPLDQRVLYALKLSRHHSLNPSATARMVDESNKKLEQKWAADNADISKEVATSIWKHYREPSVDLGQRAAR